VNWGSGASRALKAKRRISLIYASIILSALGPRLFAARFSHLALHRAPSTPRLRPAITRTSTASGVVSSGISAALGIAIPRRAHRE